MKILYVTHQFLPDYVAGTEILVHRTAREFARRGHGTEVFAGFPSVDAAENHGRLDSYVYEGIPVYRSHYHRRFKIGDGNQMLEEYDNPFVLENFVRALEKSEPDLVHIYHLHRLSARIVEVCKASAMPVVFTATDYWAFCPTCQLFASDGRICPGPDRHMANCFRHMAEYAGMARWFDVVPDDVLGFFIRAGASGIWPKNTVRNILRALLDRPRLIRSMMAMTDEVQAPTRLLREMLVRFGLDERKIKTVPFGVEYPDAEIRRGEREGGKLRVGFIGSLLFHKGAHVLCEAVRLLSEDTPVQVDIYGSPKHRPDYARLLESIVGGDPRVSFRGGFPPESLFPILGRMDVLAVPSLWHENTPLVVHSAQAACLPVIAADVDGIGEVVADEDNGLLFEKGNAEQLASILERLCRKPEILERLSKRARRPLSVEAYADEIEKTYWELVEP